MGNSTVGIIGLGRMGARWAQAARLEGVRVVSALDPSPEPFGVLDDPKLRDLHVRDADAFWQAAPDAVVVAAPAPQHVPALRQGIARGARRFVIEKPFATSCNEALEGRRLAHDAGARVVVNHGRDYASNYLRLPEVADRFGLGELRSMHVTVGAIGFGCLGIHYFRLFVQLFGAMPEWVIARTTTPGGPNPRGAQYDDPGGVALFGFPGERRAVLDCGDDVGVPPRMELIFTLGRIDIGNEMEPWQVWFREEQDRSEPLTRYGTPVTSAAYPDFEPFGVVEGARAALRDALSDAEPVCGIEAGLEAMELFAAVRWSARSETRVDFPLGDEILEASYSIP
jgi:predicted dehydrogenase